MKNASIYCVFGNDEYRVSAAIREKIDELVPLENQAFGLEVIEAQADNVDGARQIISRVLESLQTMTMFGGDRVVWMKDANMLNDSVVGRSAVVKTLVNELGALIKAGLPDDVRLVVTSPKIDKRYAFYKACKAAGELQEFSVPEKSYKADEHAGQFLTEMLQQAGLKMSPSTRDLFVEKVGTETRQIANEVEKLAVYMNRKGEVSAADVTTISSASRDVLSWDFAEAVASRNLEKALGVLRQLMFQGESAVGLIMGLENRFRDLLIIRHAIHQRWLGFTGAGKWQKASWNVPPDAEDALAACEGDPRNMNPFRVGMLATEAKKYTRRELQMAQALAFQAHQELVSSSLPKELILEVLVLKLFTARAKV